MPAHNDTKKSKPYHAYLHTLRIAAVIGVIAIHTSGYVLYDVPVASFQWWIANIYNACSRWCIPVFIMISGAVILSRDYPSIGYFLFKRLKRVALPAVIWVILYYIYELAVSNRSFDLTYLTKIILKFHDKNGLSFHFWFIPVILGLYLAAPVIQILTSHASKKLILYFLMLWCLFAVVLPFFKHTLHVHIDIEPTIFVLYAGYFVLGYFLHHNPPNMSWPISALLFMIGAIWTALGMFYLNRGSPASPNTFFYGYNAPNVMLMSVSLFLIVHRISKQCRVVDSRWTKTLGDAVFGIFLIHIFFLNPLKYAHNGLFNPMITLGAFLGIPLSVLIVFCFSLSIVALLKKIPVMKHTV